MQLCKVKWTFHVLTEGVVVVSWIGALLAAHHVLEPKHSGFFCDDRSIQYPYSESTVANNIITSLTLVLPAAVMVLTELMVCLRPMRCCASRQPRPWRSQVRVWSKAVGYVHYFLGYLLYTTVIVFLKNATGRLRPHFLAVCQPNVNLSTCVGYVSDYNCTNNESIDRRVKFARLSFPSGHSASSVYMSLFIILYLEGSAKLQRNTLFKLTLYALLTFYAIWCCTTRVIDHMHHLGDVLVGSGLGTLTAIAVYYGGARGYLIESSTNSGQACVGDDSELRVKNHSNAARMSSDHTVNMGPVLDTNDSNNRHGKPGGGVEEDEEENSESLEAEAPATPTPLLLHQSSSIHGRASFMLERDKNNFRKFSLR